MEEKQYIYKDDESLKYYTIHGIDKNGKNFMMRIYAKNITDATKISVCDYIKEVTSVERLNY